MIKKPFTRKFRDNVCESKPQYDWRRVPLSITLDEGSYEALKVLSEFGAPKKVVSRLINDAVFRYLQCDDIETTLKRAYSTWKAETD
jgi:hypothetical protein